MDEKPTFTNEEKGKAIVKMIFILFGLDGAAAVILVIIPMFFMGIDNFADGMPLTVLPFVAVGTITFAYFQLKMKKINES